jgi:hypothetical protein
MDHIGIDVHKKESQLCIPGERGELREPRIRTTPERFAAGLGERPRARILVEASTEREWVARGLEGVGHAVIVMYSAKGVASIIAGGVAVLLFERFGSWSACFYGGAMLTLMATVIAFALRLSRSASPIRLAAQPAPVRNSRIGA